MQERKTKRKLISPLFQALMIALSGIIIALAFFLRIESFKTNDEPVVLEYISPSSLREFGGFPLLLQVGLQIDRFQEFDVIKNSFHFSGNLWFDFDAGALPIEFLNNFKFEQGTLIARSDPDIRISGTRQKVLYAIEVAYKSGLIFSDFPVDDHRVDLVLTLPFVSTEEILLEALTTDFIFQGKLTTFGWNTIGRAAKAGYRQINLSEQSETAFIAQPVVNFSLNVERYGIRSVLAVLLPIFLIYYLIFFALSVETTSSITTVLGCITGLLAYRYVIEQLSPKTGDLMLSDYLFFLLLGAAILVFLLNNIDVFAANVSRHKKKVGIVLIHCFTVVTTLYLLFLR